MKAREWSHLSCTLCLRYKGFAARQAIETHSLNLRTRGKEVWQSLSEFQYSLGIQHIPKDNQTLIFMQNSLPAIPWGADEIIFFKFCTCALQSIYRSLKRQGFFSDIKANYHSAVCKLFRKPTHTHTVLNLMFSEVFAEHKGKIYLILVCTCLHFCMKEQLKAS